ncbi:MAG: abortive infection family protein [Cyanobacteria bacterium J06650_10]
MKLNQYVSICSKESDQGFHAALKSIKDTFEELSDLYIRFITVSLEGKEDSIPSTELPYIESADKTLKTVIEEFRASIQSGKYLSSIDRLHTAFHAFLRQKASESGCTLQGNEGITKIYSILRQSGDIAESPRVEKILKMVATIVNEFNEIRNHHSLAHPNKELLSEDDALFVVNCISATFHYLNARL